jgi:hypothetical protein
MEGKARQGKARQGKALKDHEPTHLLVEVIRKECSLEFKFSSS